MATACFHVVPNLVGSAPGILDTLNELATALGNDPNFATTVTNEIAKKSSIDDTSGLFGGNVPIRLKLISSGPLSGNWGQWDSWSACSGGIQTRKRACNDPKPSGIHAIKIFLVVTDRSHL